MKIFSRFGIFLVLLLLTLFNNVGYTADSVFDVKIAVVDHDTIQLQWDIKAGHYLLKKFQLTSDVPEITLSEPTLPKGTIKKDPFFGELQVYQNHLEFNVPIIRSDNAPSEFNINITYQGCMDSGECFPSQEIKRKIIFNNTMTVPVKAPPPATNQFSGFSNDLGLGEDVNEILDVDQAFQVSVTSASTQNITVNFQVTEGYYLYRKKLGFSIEDNDKITLLAAQLPDAKVKHDEFFGEMEIYQKSFIVTIPVKGAAVGDEIKLKIAYQGCAEAGICYPPIKKLIDLKLTKEATAVMASQPVKTAQSTIPEQDRLTQLLSEKKLWVVILGFFVSGLLLAFTPCVFPMVPILSSIIAGQGDKITTRKAFVLSLVYVLAMALTYTLAGIAAGLLGKNLQAVFQDPWILSSFSLLFVLLALSMFGFYELQLPSSLQTRLAAISQKQQGGRLIGVAIMGFLSALIVGPCVAPPLAAALIYIGDSGNAILGGTALFALSMGMGTPLIIIGTSAGKLLPKAGAWMTATKAIFGVLLLGLAIWMLERVFSYQITLTLWAVLLISSAIYMGALEPITGKSGWHKLWKSLGVLCLIYGVIILLAVTAGGGKFGVLQPLKDVVKSSSTGEHSQTELAFKPIKNIEELQLALATAKENNQAVMLDFFATWCVECVRMERSTFSDPKVYTATQNMVLLKADVTDYNEAHQQLLKSFKLPGPPATLFYDNQGNEHKDLRSIGYLDTQQFLSRITRL